MMVTRLANVMDVLLLHIWVVADSILGQVVNLSCLRVFVVFLSSSRQITGIST
jgi:hypothetical protein